MRVSVPALCVLVAALWACSHDLDTLECLVSSDCDGGFCVSGVCRDSTPQDVLTDTEQDSDEVLEGDLPSSDLDIIEDPNLNDDSESNDAIATDVESDNPTVSDAESDALIVPDPGYTDPTIVELIGVDAVEADATVSPCGGSCGETTCVDVIVNDELQCVDEGVPFCCPNALKFALGDFAPDDLAISGLTNEEIGGLLTVKSTFTLIHEGPFLMGVGDASTNRGPLHEVELGSFFIQDNEVTVRDFFVCVNAVNFSGVQCHMEHILADADTEGCRFPVTSRDILTEVADHPINCVDYHGALEFCAWIGGRLPTEAEWEKAARGGCELREPPECEDGSDAPTFPWGDTEPGSGHACWEQTETCTVRQHEAGTSVYGLYDMAGNVSEWVYDGLNDTVYGDADHVYCPAEAPGTSQPGVVRGGAYDDHDKDHISVTIREPLTRDQRVPTTGFRCVIDVDRPTVVVDTSDE